MTTFLRSKPTKHVQKCGRCRKEMEKGELQYVREIPNWRWVDHEYYHADCFFLEKTQKEDFMNHFHKQYGMELNAKTFIQVYRKGTWKNFTNGTVRQPFEIFRDLEQHKVPHPTIWVKDVFQKMVWERVFEHGEDSYSR